MLGAIIGDIVGSRFAFSPTNDYNFEFFGHGCAFTDDTICTIAVADALIKGRDYGESIHEWCRRYPNPKGGYGGRFRQWVMSDRPQPYGSFGNGSAMRVSPVAWWCDCADVCAEARKTAACTHSHPLGIEGAEAVAIAIYECRELHKSKNNQPLTADDILWGGLSHAVDAYAQFPQLFKVDLEKCRNRFDETCQGTVPVALWIVMHSTGFEDAIRQAVSLGADADTLGAIVGSIAEALWGIPEWMKEKTLAYLTPEMRDVVTEFHHRVRRRRKLTQRCQYYKVDEFAYDTDHPQARQIEKEWTDDLTRSYDNADRMKEQMVTLFAMEQWQTWADAFDLPLSLVGYIFKHTAGPRKGRKPFLLFLDDNYSSRKELAAKKKAAKQQQAQMEAVMLWKLGLGNMGRYFNGQDPMPSKEVVATAQSWQIEAMPDDPDQVSTCPVDWPLTQRDIDILRRGHIPDAMEDHWFMYADDGCIRYFRSWTGQCSFEADYEPHDDHYRITRVRVNRNLAEFGVNGDAAALALLRYLLAAETAAATGAAPHSSWRQYLCTRRHLQEKYH